MFLEIVKAPHWAREPYYVRRRPDYSSNTLARVEARLRLAEAAHAAYGETGVEAGIPVVARRVQEAMLSAPVEPVELPELEVVPMGPMRLMIVEKNRKEPGLVAGH